MVLLKLMTSTLLKNLRHPLRVKWQRQDLNAGLLGSLKDDQRYPRALTKPVSGILCKNYLSRVLLPSRTHSKYLLWGNCEILTKWTLREKTSFHPRLLAFAKFRVKRLQKEVLRRILPKIHLSSVCWKNHSCKSQTRGYRKFCTFASKARIPFLSKACPLWSPSRICDAETD